MQKITISKTGKKILVEHAQNQMPNESCAMLFGKDSKVSEIFLTENTDKSPICFTISEKQIIQGYKTAEDKQWEVIGIFHSHPDSEAYPSDTDKKFMQVNSVAWVIYSGQDESLRAYILESEIKEIPIEE